MNKTILASSVFAMGVALMAQEASANTVNVTAYVYTTTQVVNVAGANTIVDAPTISATSTVNLAPTTDTVVVSLGVLPYGTTVTPLSWVNVTSSTAVVATTASKVTNGTPSISYTVTGTTAGYSPNGVVTSSTKNGTTTVTTTYHDDRTETITTPTTTTYTTTDTTVTTNQPFNKIVEDIQFTLGPIVNNNWILSADYAATPTSGDANGIGGSAAHPTTLALYSGTVTDGYANNPALATVQGTGFDKFSYAGGQQQGQFDSGNTINTGAGNYTFEIVTTSGPNGPGSGTFTITAVPEVSTWLMMLGGFTGLVFVGRRREKNERISV